MLELFTASSLPCLSHNMLSSSETGSMPHCGAGKKLTGSMAGVSLLGIMLPWEEKKEAERKRLDLSLDWDSGINFPDTHRDVLDGLPQRLHESQSCVSELSMSVWPPPETAMLAEVPILCFQLGSGAGSCALLPGSVLFNKRKTLGSEASA